MAKEKYLDYLVVEVAGLDILKKHPLELRPKVFLKEVGIGPTEDYIQNTLREKVPLHLIPSDELHVFTPEYGFIYQNKGFSVSTTTTRINEFGSEGTLEEAVRHLVKLADENARDGRLTTINVLFFDEDSKKELDKQIKPRGFKFVSTADLEIPDYGTVKLYRYSKPFSPS